MKRIILKSIITGLFFISSQVVMAQTPNPYSVQNDSDCDIYVWLEYYGAINSDPCDPDCNDPKGTSSKVFIESGDNHTFYGTGLTGAWGMVYFDGPANLGDYDSNYSCGRQRSETCNSIGMTISFPPSSCSTATIQ